jgi:CPA2 family monovalent cation:H+ antiporter-2
MHIDPVLPVMVGALLAILLIGFALKALGQPQIVGYLVAGVVIGPHGLALLDEPELIGRIGDMGLIVLLFFIGMEASPGALLRRWRLAISGVTIQIAATVAIVWIIGLAYGWSTTEVLLFGFVISLSSTAVVLKLLKDWDELNTQTGQNVLVMLLAQDMALIPMIIAVNMMGGHQVSAAEIVAQLAGAAVLIGIATWVFTSDHVRLPFARKLSEDHELQVFAALMLSFGLALISGMLGLSTALGAFIAGLVVSSAREVCLPGQPRFGRMGSPRVIGPRTHACGSFSVALRLDQARNNFHPDHPTLFCLSSPRSRHEAVGADLR